MAGNSASVSAYGSDNVLEFLVVENKNGALTVSLRRNVNIRGDHRLVVMVTGPAITEGHVTGSGDLHIPGSLDGGDISFKVTGSGKVEVGRLIAGKLAVSIAGSGDVVINECVAKNVYGTVTGSGDIRLLAGNAAYAEYNVRGSGDIRAFVMRAEKVMATVSGSGNVECSAKTGLEANVSGSGRIIYEGNAVVRNNGKKESVIMR